jgi:hypothetical protein
VKRLGLTLAILFGLSAGLPAAEEPRITASLAKTEIYEGQSVEYQIRVENVDNPPMPEVRGAGDFDVAFLGQQSLGSQFSITINGVRRDVVHHGRAFHYRLTPKRLGTILIPAPVLRIAGKTLSGPVRRLTVLPPNAQDLAAVEQTVDRPAVYPTQPFAVTLSVLVKELPPPAADRDPLSVQNPPPVLRIPWLADEELPPGLSPQVDWKTWATRFIDRDGVGFGINGLARQDSLFSMFGESSVVTFRPKSQPVVRRDAQGHEAKYLRYDFSRTFTAKQAGPIALGAVTLQGTFAAGVSESGRLTGREVFAASKPLEITVKGVPAEGRPEDYVGAIGHFALSGSLTPRRLKVGDPMTFTLTLRGSGSLAAVKPPDLGKVAAVAGRFKVYDATQKIEADAASFVYSLRPLAEGQDPFPAVPLAYFDADRQQYVTVQTDPIPMQVARAERLSSDQIVGSLRAAGPLNGELESRREGIFANITDVALVRDQSVHPLAWLMGLGGCAAGYVLVAVGTVMVRRRWEDKSSLRRRAAAARARQRLRTAMAQWHDRRVREAADLVQDSLAGLVADVAGLDEAGLTPKDVLRHLQAWGFPETLTARAGAVLESCDAARYGGTGDSDSLGEEAREVLESVIETLRTQRRFR